MSESSLLLNPQLARRIELAEALSAVECAETLDRLGHGSGAAVERIAGGFAVYCGAESPVTQAVGLGLDGPVNGEEFDRLENFYRTRNEAVRVETCPLADASLIELFGKRGYRVTEFTNVMACSLAAANPSTISPQLSPGITIDKIGPEHFDLWTLTVGQGFADHFPVTKELLEIMKMFAQGPSSECYLARVDGKAAGGGTIAIRNEVAGLFGASTLPDFRGRGIQTALLHARLARAKAAGCDLAVSLARPGGVSERNILRRGFTALYTRVKFEREWK